MAFRAISGLIIPLFFSATLWADELKINPNHPSQYAVVKGDTLWDISGKFLQHPWQWPELWHNNPQIKNPHWIYPGDVLYFSYVNGVPSLSFSPQGSEPMLFPHIRESAVEQAIPVIPADRIAQFLSSPRVVAEGELNNAPYIVEIAGERLMGAAGDKIYVRGIGEPTSLSYTIYRPGPPYISPETQEILGYEAEYVGDAALQATGDPSTLLINKSSSQIRHGDRLMAATEKGLALNYFPRPPETAIAGRILRVLGDGISQIGQYDVVVIDKGTADGLEAGHTLDIYRTGRIIADPYRAEKSEAVKLPDELAGVLIVFRPFERVSYALVMQAEGAIHVMDKVQTP
ncbi:MAG: LysM peptidoglycan-binding domain-containing protein [Methylomonas sp.]